MVSGTFVAILLDVMKEENRKSEKSSDLRITGAELEPKLGR
jgi:hypothetical protein